MPNKQIEDLNTISSIAAGDQFIVNDISDISSDPTGTVKNISATQMGILETRVSSADADVTGEVGVLDCVDISGYTADRDYILPTTAAVGDRAGVCITTGDDAYELDLHTVSASGDTINGVDSSVGTASWSRLFITGEVVIFRCVVANTAWIVEYDGRIPCKCQLVRSTAQSIAHASTIQILLNTSKYDIGGLGDTTTNNRIDIRRGGVYKIYGHVMFNSLGDGEFVIGRININDVLEGWLKFYFAQTSASVLASNLSIDRNLSSGDHVKLLAYHTQGAAQDTMTGNHEVPTLGLVEIL